MVTHSVSSGDGILADTLSVYGMRLLNHAYSQSGGASRTDIVNLERLSRSAMIDLSPDMWSCGLPHLYYAFHGASDTNQD